MVVVGVELPFEKVIGGNDAKRVAEDGRAAVRSGPQLDHLRTQRHQFVVPVSRPVIQRNLYAHPASRGPRVELLAAPAPRSEQKASPSARGSRCFQATLTTTPTPDISNWRSR